LDKIKLVVKNISIAVPIVAGVLLIVIGVVIFLLVKVIKTIKVKIEETTGFTIGLSIRTGVTLKKIGEGLETGVKLKGADIDVKGKIVVGVEIDEEEEARKKKLKAQEEEELMKKKGKKEVEEEEKVKGKKKGKEGRVELEESGEDEVGVRRRKRRLELEIRIKKIHLELGSNIKLRRITYEECEDEKDKVLSYGFGYTLYKSYWSDKEVVIRRYVSSTVHSSNEEDPYVREWYKQVHKKSQLQHKYLLDFYGIIEEHPHYSIVTKYFSRGSLYDMLVKRKEEMKEKEVARIAQQVAEVMEYLHSKDAVHGHIALRNVFLDENNEVKVDFGADFQDHFHINNKLYGKQHAYVGAVSWSAPEVVDKKQYSAKSDSFSFGVFLWELSVRDDPFKERNTIEVACPLIHKDLRLKVPDSVPAVFQQLMKTCWEADPSKRPTSGSLVQDLKKYYESL